MNSDISKSQDTRLRAAVAIGAGSGGAIFAIICIVASISHPSLGATIMVLISLAWAGLFFTAARYILHRPSLSTASDPEA